MGARRRALRWRAVVSFVAKLVVAALALGAPVARAADEPLQRLSQHGHAMWRTQDGAFGNPSSVVQAKDGYLYLGTSTGLVRFDGARFVDANVYPEGSIANWRIASVLAASDGSLWVGASGHAARIKDGHLASVDFVGAVLQLTEDRHGAVWSAKVRTGATPTPVCRFAFADGVPRLELACHGPPEIPFLHASVVQSGGQTDDLWIGSSGGLCRWLPGRTAECFLQQTLQPLNGLQGVTAVLPAHDGTLWVGIAKAGRDLGLGRLVDGQWRPFSVNGLDGSTLVVSALMMDREGSLWVGTADQGVYRIHRSEVEHFAVGDGLSGNTVAGNGLFEDAEGTVWVATTSGLDAFRRLPVTVYSTKEGLEADSVESVLAARDGTVWIGNLSLSTIVGGRVAAPPLPAFFRGKAVGSMLEDHAGRLWINLEHSLYVLSGGVVSPVTAPDGGPFGAVQGLIEDRAHDVWAWTVGPHAPVYRVHDDVVVEDVRARVPDLHDLVPDPAGGIWVIRSGDLVHLGEGPARTIRNQIAVGARIQSVAVDTNGLLVATTNKGLWIVDGASQWMLDRSHGLPCDDLRLIATDATGDVWLTAVCGLIRIGRAELDRWRVHPDTRIADRLLDITDGFQAGVPSFSPRASLAPDGRLWFATGRTVQVVDPKTAATRSAPPPVRIEEVTADRVAYPVSGPIRLPPNPRNIDVRFTALTFVLPGKVRFLYRLEGRDTEWRDAGGVRQASYSDLPPGHYRFRVKAANSDGVWNEEGATASFEVVPAYYQTRWFTALVVALALALLYGLYVVRLRQVASRIRERVAAKTDERERIARNLHDTLLQGTQALVYNVQAETRRLPSDDPTRDRLERALANADALIAEGRERIEELRTATDVGTDLCDSLYRVGDALARNHGIAFEAMTEGPVRPLRANVHDEAYQIAREALLNAFQHARATSIECHVLYGDDHFRLRVRDDGIGLDPAILETGARAKHWGLLGMRERAEALGAVVDVWSRPGGGTEIEFRIPAAAAYRTPALRRRWPWQRRMPPDRGTLRA